jgi:hypothetical protein
VRCGTQEAENYTQFVMYKSVDSPVVLKFSQNVQQARVHVDFFFLSFVISIPLCLNI